MTITQPHHFLTNEIISARKWDAETRDQANGLFWKPCAMLAKTFITEWVSGSVANSKANTNNLANVHFDKIVYDFSFNGSKMCYASTFLITTPGWYELSGAYAWSIANSFNDATPENGTRQLAFGLNTCGQWRSNRLLFPYESEQLIWENDPPISPSGFTPLTQPQKLSTTTKLARGDQVEMFAGQDSGWFLQDAPVDDQNNPESVNYTIWMAIEYKGRYTS